MAGDSAQTFAETFQSMPRIRRLIPLLSYEVDRSLREVKATPASRPPEPGAAAP